jgi:hypothetical protein
MAENKNAKTPTDGGAGFIDGVWHGPKSWQCQCGRPYTVTCISSKPPKREWVGLTDEEIHEIDGYEEDRKMYRFARAIEAKLKEKNHG